MRTKLFKCLFLEREIESTPIDCIHGIECKRTVIKKIG